MTLKRLSILTRLWLILSILAFPVLAQEPAADSSEPAGDPALTTAADAEQLLEKVQKTDIELSSVGGDLKTATGEDLILLRNRFDELAEQQYADLNHLLKAISDREKNGNDVAQLELQAEQLLKRSSRRLRTYIKNFEGSLQEQAAKRETLSADELERFEHRMAVATTRLDHLYLDLIKLTEAMAATGLPVESEMDYLQQQLSDRGQSLLGILELIKKQLGQQQQMAKRAPDNAQVQAQLFAAEERYDSNKAALQATIHMMKTLGMDYADLEVRALETTGEITPEAVDVEVAGGLAKHELTKAKNYLVDYGPRLLVRLLVIAGILLAFWLLARIARRIASKVLNRSRLAPSELLKETIIAWIGRLVLIAGFIMVLSQLGISLGPVLDDPEPVIKLHTLNDSSVDFVVRPWAKTDDYWDLHWDITRAVKIRFDEEGISIPYPQRDVHLIPTAGDADEDVAESPPETT